VFDTVARQAFDGPDLSRLDGKDVIARRSEIKYRRKAGAAREIIKPAHSLALFGEMIKQDGVVARCGKSVRQHASLRRFVHPQLRPAPERRDVMLEQAREFGVIGNRQDARGQSTPPGRADQER
jgi:hypothetical protein